MKLRDLTTFILGRFVVVGSYSWKTRYDSKKDDEKVLGKYIDCEVFKIESSDTFTEMNQPVIIIYIYDHDIAKEEKAKNKEKSV